MRVFVVRRASSFRDPWRVSARRPAPGRLVRNESFCVFDCEAKNRVQFIPGSCKLSSENLPIVGRKIIVGIEFASVSTDSGTTMRLKMFGQMAYA